MSSSMAAGASDGRGVVWFRRDLRLDDNPAWSAATAAHDEVVALFVVEPELLRSAGEHRRNLLLANLGALDDELAGLGGGLVVRTGPAAVAVDRLVGEVGASRLYLNDDVTPFSMRRDQEALDELSIPVERFHGSLVHEPGAVLTKKGTLSQVFTPFYKRWVETPIVPWPKAGVARPVTVDSDRLPTGGQPVQAPGANGAWERLDRWLDRVDAYQDTRDLPAIDGTSSLSADLKFGTISPRAVLDAVGSASAGRSAFVRQLAWRDWWAQTLGQHPDLADRSLRADYDRIDWHRDEEGFTAWCAGQTGFPIVDAGMRQLVATGWMHNRVRMITASFLVKDLLIDWRRGERFFRHHLIDADVAQNAGNWQWVAGTGPDAAPYFRVFNPTSQGRKFDPTGDYVRRWVPELASLPARWVHEPSGCAPLDLAAVGVILGDTFPAPLVDHATAREGALSAYKAARARNGRS
ncbi:MAG: cryptochrome/photolyase family protein [Acidimicrobiales bacterium]